MTKRTIGFILVVVAVAGAIGLFLLRRSANHVEYRTEPVVRGDIDAAVVTTGTLDPLALVDVGSEVSGIISKINVDFNSPVKKGQVLAEIDRSSFEDAVKENEANSQAAEAAVEKARVQLSTAKVGNDRAQDLFSKNLISSQDKEAAEEAYKTAQDDVRVAQDALAEARSELSSSRIDLSKTLILSPIDGVVVSRDVNVGQTVAAKYEAPDLFKIANDLKKMKVDCAVDQADVGNVKEGMQVRFSVDAFPGQTYVGRVVQVREGADTDQGVVTYDAEVQVDNPEAKLMPGMTALVYIYTAHEHDVLTVPNAALKFRPSSIPTTPSKSAAAAGVESISRRKDSTIWILDAQGKLTPVQVKTGITDNVRTEILAGSLKQGDRIVTGAK